MNEQHLKQARSLINEARHIAKRYCGTLSYINCGGLDASESDDKCIDCIIKGCAEIGKIAEILREREK